MLRSVTRLPDFTTDSVLNSVTPTPPSESLLSEHLPWSEIRQAGHPPAFRNVVSRKRAHLPQRLCVMRPIPLLLGLLVIPIPTLEGSTPVVAQEDPHARAPCLPATCRRRFCCGRLTAQGQVSSKSVVLVGEA